MICFLTSSPALPDGKALNPANGFVRELARVLPGDCRALFVCSDPQGWARTDLFAAAVRQAFRDAGFTFRCFAVLDGRNEGQARALIAGSDLVILGGGHVPTQNRFFRKIGLREALAGYAGVVVGISAGSMNSAGLVYAHPELPGEATDPEYRRFLPGLGLTRTNLLPHYVPGEEELLDGLRVYSDIACPDSAGRTFYAVPDGTYLYIEDGREELRGAAYRIRDGRMSQISREGETAALQQTPPPAAEG